MKPLGRWLSERAARLLDTPDPTRRVAGDVFLFGVALVRSARRDHLNVRASTLSYSTLFALVPVLLLAFSLMEPLGVMDSIATHLRESLYETVLAASVSDVGPWLDGLVRSISFEALGVVGFLGLLLTGFSLYATVEKAFNDIFQARVRRPVLLRLILFYAVVTLVPLLLTLGYLASGSLGGWLPANVLGWLVPVAMTAAGLVLAIKLLPQCEVRWTAALAGGLVAAILFEFVKFGFGAYTDLLGARSAATRLYGSLGLVPVFLLYVWLLWLVVLVGVEVAYVVNHARLLAKEVRARLIRQDQPRFRADPVVALLALVALVGRLLEGAGPARGEDIADRIGLSDRLVVDALDILEAARLVVQTDRGRWVLAESADRLTGAEVVNRCRRACIPTFAEDTPGLPTIEAAWAGLAGRLVRPVSELVTEGVRPPATAPAP
ncbi:MAG: YihY/virulence factor BrkB family protein [Deltaproteobacteria bacterium]|nr:YihY/virulence factor BrkB family protein [Deltaproteobacteria bacterium]